MTISLLIMTEGRELCLWIGEHNLGPPTYGSNMAPQSTPAAAAHTVPRVPTLALGEHSSGSRALSSAGMGSPLFDLGDTLLVIIFPFVLVPSRDLWEVPRSTNFLSCCTWWSPHPEVWTLCVLTENLIVGRIGGRRWRVVMTASELT